MRTIEALLLLTLLLPAAGCKMTSAILNGGRGYSERLICHIEDRDPENILLGAVSSPDSRRIAYVTLDGSKRAVVVDGKEGKLYDVIPAGSLAFSPDGRRVIYEAKVREIWTVVIDGQGGELYDGSISAADAHSGMLPCAAGRSRCKSAM